MRVLVLEPGYCPYVAFFRSAEEAVRMVVPGPARVSRPFGNEVIALVSSEQQDGLSFNRTIDETSFVNGRALIFGWDGERLCELSRKQADRYYRRYLYPEKLVDEDTGLRMIPQQPKVKPKDERFGHRPAIWER
ncbi:hypothetical protein [uncultured Subdoligranulum sp.]|uniref:DUF3846 domain-containing protein n=1 Tax=uncultured Subdoligranulum sp. TaxID=512298 RepID=UPI00262998C4|nr:hypothetical protein [uncultured Subdoligranulum sp.]